MQLPNNFDITTISAASTLAKILATHLATSTKTLAFSGDLGSGKTFLCQQIINFLSESPQQVTSPTFNLLQTYDTKFGTVYHFDLYRLENLTDTYELGIEEALAQHICLIEWPKIVQPLLPLDTVWLELTHDASNQRHAKIWV